MFRSPLRAALTLSLLFAASAAQAQPRATTRAPATARRPAPAARRAAPSPAPAPADLHSRADTVGSLGAPSRALPPVASTPPSPRPADVGEISPAEIRAVITRHLGAVSRCHERGLSVAPHASGVVFVHFEIGREGTVTDASVGSSTYPVEGVAECIVAATRTWVFPPPREGGPVTVDYPFTLEAPEAATEAPRRADAP